MASLLWLIPLGFFVGTFGTLIGAGGGFILVPILLLIYPEKSPETITSISLAVVFFNALSGTLAYKRMKRIDYRSGLMFAIASVPGAILGTIVVKSLSRHFFDTLFGVLLLILATYLILKSKNVEEVQDTHPKGHLVRRLTDSDGIEYVFSYNLGLGLAFSAVIGFMSTLLGIGGGIIHVPVLVRALNFPVHLATATSHFVLAINAFAGSLSHYLAGDLNSGMFQALGISAGAVFGAQAGAKLSKKLKGPFILRALAIALAMVGVRILISVYL